MFHCTFIHLFGHCLLYTVFLCTLIHVYFVSVYCIQYFIVHTSIHFVTVECIQCFIAHSYMSVLSVFTVYSFSLYIHLSKLSVFIVYSVSLYTHPCLFFGLFCPVYGISIQSYKSLPRVGLTRENGDRLVMSFRFHETNNSLKVLRNKHGICISKYHFSTRNVRLRKTDDLVGASECGPHLHNCLSQTNCITSLLHLILLKLP